jgi:nitrate reductase alpha subunit
MGGFVRSAWPEVSELIAAAHVHTISAFGPDRVVGFSPIPAMSQVSYSAGTRFLSMIGGTILSFYDWYADMPIASPQVFGDQTDVPESADWFNSSYLIIWGTNLPITRTPDAHFMTEARYRGQKVVVVSPDYSDHTKFADDWLAAAPGTDGALGMAMGHVILTEFFRDRQVPYFTDYVKSYTDLAFLVTLREREDGYVPDRFLTAADLGHTGQGAAHQTVLLDSATGEPFLPNGTLASRFSEAGVGKWNLHLGGIDPVLTLYGTHEDAVSVDLPRFDAGETEGGGVIRRGVPVMRIGGKLVTTVFDLLMAQYAVRRDGLPGQWPAGYDDPQPYTPAWQEAITSVPAAAAARVAREFARNAELSRGRSMPRAVITSPEWSGSETGGRRYSPFVVNVERKKPWHTLTGRMHFFLDHDWIAEYGECLPTYRPPLDYARHFGEQGLREQGRPEITVRYLTPHSKWSIHSEYQDNLHMLRLFRGGPVIWMSQGDAAKIGVADNDWIEAYNRNGVVACRAVVTHRMPEGTVFMYHAKDRHLMTPKSEVSGWHGGGDNSLTRLVIKPTHMIGGYAQLSYGFNYYGPTGNQRDEITVIRRRSQQVQY